MKLIRKSIIVLSVIVCFWTSHFTSSRADMMPPDPPRSANPEAIEATNVRMMAETVLLEIGASKSQNPWAAKVTANFTMHNLGDEVENLEVRFPLNYTFSGGEFSCENPSPKFPSINDIQVRVDGLPKSVRIEYVTITQYAEEEPYPTKNIPCWAHFQITFPPQEDVFVQITYTALPYDNYSGAQFEYAYILETGAGWAGTIGSADITIQFPYEINSRNFYSCLPEICAKNDKEIVWHFEDFEPDFNVSVAVLPPNLWKIIVTETDRVTANPNDGESWGRLGKAYKEAVTYPKIGFREPIADFDMYKLSKSAYEKALALLPNDADWHYGYAELLCHRAELNQFENPSSLRADLISCVEQLKIALEIKPSHEQAKELLQRLQAGFWEYCADWNKCVNVVDLTGSIPDYLILTPQISTPTSTATKTNTPTVHATMGKSSTSSPTDTHQVSKTPSPTSTLMVAQKDDVKVTQTPIPTMNTDISTAKTFPISGIAFTGISIALIVFVIRVTKRKKSKR